MIDYQVPDVDIGYMHGFPTYISIPDNWIKADGAVLNINKYPELYKKIGRMYCSDDDSPDIFRLPDHREKTLDPATLTTKDRQFITVTYAIKAKHKKGDIDD